MTSSESRKEYMRRIYKVQDYIETNLYSSPSLEELAFVAGFSKFHFHRIFKSLVKESLSQYVNRLKLERAAYMLIHRHEMTVTEIAYYLGFVDSAVFSRAFKNHFKISPTYYKKHYSKNCKEPYKISKYNDYVAKIEDESKGLPIKVKVEILTISEVKVAYVRYIGTYKNLAAQYSKLLQKLIKYLDEQRFSQVKNSKLLTIYHDNPQFTEKHQLRTSICITINHNAVVNEANDLGCMLIPSGKYVVGHFNIFQSQYSDAWDFMYEKWLTNSGYKPCDSFPFEVYLNDPNTNLEHKHLVDIYLPIEPL